MFLEFSRKTDLHFAFTSLLSVVVLVQVEVKNLAEHPVSQQNYAERKLLSRHRSMVESLYKFSSKCAEPPVQRMEGASVKGLSNSAGSVKTFDVFSCDTVARLAWISSGSGLTSNFKINILPWNLIQDLPASSFHVRDNFF